MKEEMSIDGIKKGAGANQDSVTETAVAVNRQSQLYYHIITIRSVKHLNNSR